MNTYDPILLDKQDPFPAKAHRFDMPRAANGGQLIYFNGNSLGPKLKSVNDALLAQCNLWGTLGVRGHFDGEQPWIHFHQKLSPHLARLVGAKSHEVVAMGTLTANIHLLLMSFYQPTPKRYKIIRLHGFSSDMYAIDSQVKQRMQTVAAFTDKPFAWQDAVIDIAPDDEGYISMETIQRVLALHGEQCTLVWFEAVHYLTGQALNIQAITQLAHQYGCLVGFDLAHAIANVPLALHDWDVDFAAWCSYKYLSAGPGAVAGLYVHERHALEPQQFRLSGWWGTTRETRFLMQRQFEPMPGAQGWLLSNAEMFSMHALYETLCFFDEFDLSALYDKNRRLVAYMSALLTQELAGKVCIITPNTADERGCQLSLVVELPTNAGNHEPCGLSRGDSMDLEHVFLSHGVVCDVRPGVIRVAPIGLYNTFQDVFDFVQILKSILSEAEAF